jgi:hypothetical protein
MLNNYEITGDGVIHQITTQSVVSYNRNYINQRYDAYGVKNDQISHLRLGYIIGTLGFVPSSILDVGYGNGAFLKAAKNIVEKCYGHDISSYPLPDGCEFAPLTQFAQVYTFYDSLEHFTEIDFVKDLPCNYCVISLPWCHYPNDEWFKNWKHRRPDEHLWHFDHKSLQRFMYRMGFQLIDYTNVEDSVRKGILGESNILTGIFQRV